MRAMIDFSLFRAPTEAHGNITGDLEVPEHIRTGDEVLLLTPGRENWFSGKLRVISVTRPRESLSGKMLIGLEDVVAPSAEEADRLVKRLENEKNLFFDRY